MSRRADARSISVANAIAAAPRPQGAVTSGCFSYAFHPSENSQNLNFVNVEKLQFVELYGEPKVSGIQKPRVNGATAHSAG